MRPFLLKQTPWSYSKIQSMFQTACPGALPNGMSDWNNEIERIRQKESVCMYIKNFTV
jgi:hypothetical protein